MAQGPAHSHGDRREDTADQKRNPGALVSVVREATERFKDVAAAEAEGYALQFGCVSGSDSGAMGMHYVNFPLVLDGELDATQPEIVIYEPSPNGKAAADRRRLSRARRRVERQAHRPARADGTAASTCSRPRTASACRRSTRCTSGRGRRTPPACSSTGTRTSRATRSPGRTTDPFPSPPQSRVPSPEPRSH